MKNNSNDAKGQCERTDPKVPREVDTQLCRMGNRQ